MIRIVPRTKLIGRDSTSVLHTEGGSQFRSDLEPVPDGERSIFNGRRPGPRLAGVEAH